MSNILTAALRQPIVHPSKRHPLTGALIQAVGVLPNGKVVWPIMGGDNTTPPVERPEGVTEEEWEALGDPGKRAIVREREGRVKAERERDAAKARPTPPAKKAEAAPPKQEPGDPQDVAAIVQQAVAAAIKPFQEREEQRDAERAAGKVRDAVLEAAKPRLLDATDALQIDLRGVLDEAGAADPAKVAAAIDELLKAKPHLAKSDARIAPPGIGGGAAPSNRKDAVAAILGGMQRATGVRLPSA